MLAWLRRRRSPPDIPPALWQGTLARYPFLAQRPDDELQRLRALAAGFLAQKEFHGAHGLTVTDDMALDISAQAVLPLLHLAPPASPGEALRWYDDFVGIVVHAGEVLAQREVVDEDGVVHHYSEVLTGEAMDGGPVMLSWHDVRDAGETARDGYNVVIHEFIHKIDLRDGLPDGCPPLPSAAARQAWLDTLNGAYETFREQVILAERFGGEPAWLDPYGAQSPDEFFAVACEAYFVNRPRFAGDFPALVALFDGFFKPNRVVALASRPPNAIK
ncbi:MAG: zinc-dependent peptidase [Ramlibacter sp.]|nr:zinc-dependent peptidase [Ramlibacter sp.]MCW5648803.1 zinc-dependent peptidase [Ramlibacter sp.]